MWSCICCRIFQVVIVFCANRSWICIKLTNLLSKYVGLVLIYWISMHIFFLFAITDVHAAIHLVWHVLLLWLNLIMRYVTRASLALAVRSYSLQCVTHIITNPFFFVIICTFHSSHIFTNVIDQYILGQFQKSEGKLVPFHSQQQKSVYIARTMDK